jgi:hypothetical protein
MSKINFNGKSYDRLEEMPPTEREAYTHIMALFADANQNGIPDIFEGDLRQNILTSLTSSVKIVDGNQVYTPDNMPPHVREKYERAMAKLQEMGLLQPGVHMTSEVSLSTKSADRPAPQAPQTSDLVPSAPISPSPPIVQEDSGPNIAAILVGVLILLMLLAAGAAVLLMLISR